MPQDVRGNSAPRASRSPSSTRSPDGYDTIDWIARQPWSNGDVGMWGDSYYGFTQWAAVASRHPALKAIVPRVTIADIDGWLEGVTPLYGAHYLAEFWTDHHTHELTSDWSRRPLAEVFDGVFEAIGTPLGLVRLRARALARRRAHAAVPADAHPFDALRIPTLHGVGWFDNITPPHMLDYEALVANPETAPFQYLHAGSTDHENYDVEHVPIPQSDDHAVHDDALERMLPRYIGPALDFFDAFLTRPQRPGAGAPRALAPGRTSAGRKSPSWPPPGASELRLYLADAERALRGRARRTPAARSRGARGEAAWMHDPGDLVPSTLVNPFAALSSTRTSARSSRAPTS